MLINLKFSNYKSFKGETQISMQSGKNKENSDLLIDLGKEGKYLRTLTVFGGNSSGKSNLISIFWFLKYIVLYRGQDKDEKDTLKYIPYYYCKQDKETPVSIDIEYYHKNIIYNYKIVTFKDRILSEDLTYKNSFRNSYRLIFSRSEEQVELSDKVVSKEYSALFSSLRIEKNKSFLFTLKGMQFLNIELLKNAFEWIENIKSYDFGNDRGEFNALIENVIEESDEERLKENFKKCVIFLKDCAIDIDDIFINKSSEKESNGLPTIRRKASDEKEYDTPLSLESDGTVKLIIIYMMLLNKLSEATLFVIDELDSKLHPFLTKHIVEAFNDSNINAKNIQLIHTTHSVSLLLDEHVRRDGLLFVDKNVNVSTVVTANDYANLRQQNSILKKYYEGEIGGRIERELINWVNTNQNCDKE